METLFPNSAKSPNLQCFLKPVFTHEMDSKLGSVRYILTENLRIIEKKCAFLEKPQIDFKKVTPNIVPSLDSFSLKLSVTIMEFMN